MRTNLKQKFGVVGAVLVLCLCVHAFLPPVAASKLSQLTPGTTQVDAKRILGRPVQVLSPSAAGAETWRYQVSLRFGWVDVFFDGQGRVIDHNYERF